jgi:hypothetical protein
MYRNWGCCETRSHFESSRCKFEGDMASLCSHGITSNLMSKRYGREPSTCAVREPESELISLLQWLDLSNINAEAHLSCHHFELASPSYGVSGTCAHGCRLPRWLVKMSSYIDSSCCSCRDHHLEKASAKDSSLGTMASTQTLPLTNSLSKISIPSRWFFSHEIRMPHQNVLATGHLDPGWHRGYNARRSYPYRL